MHGRRLYGKEPKIYNQHNFTVLLEDFLKTTALEYHYKWNFTYRKFITEYSKIYIFTYAFYIWEVLGGRKSLTSFLVIIVRVKT